MARLLKFDTEPLLDKAMHLFWRQGYETTSVQDLGKELDLHPGSVYNTFGDKHTLFLAALDRYAVTAGCFIPNLLRQPGSYRGAIENVFQTSVTLLGTEEGRRGCLMTNTAMERADHDVDVSRKVAAYQHNLEEALTETLNGAQAHGEIKSRSPKEIQTLARFLNGCMRGMQVVAHSSPDARLRLQAIAQIAVQTID
ncbi:TetR/AcrR family transcriptional regulator [Spirosoma arcticum]